MPADLLSDLAPLVVGLLGGGGLAALLKARPERAQVFLLGAESAVKSLREALAEADADNDLLRAEVQQLRAELATERDRVAQLATELATERGSREALEHRLAALEQAAD